ncbi:MAG TPA: hypothetical protein VK668_08660 [Mucilaginibacter sp.]|nr:hypothetical protein [Mucilaginibacter sp.]
MKPFISTSFFGFLSYVVAITLMASPWLFGFSRGAAFFLPLVFGWLQLIMAIFSKNQFGFLKVFPVPMHCFLNVVGGFILATSPFIYGYYTHDVFVPQLLLGSLAVLMGIFTKKSPLTDEPEHVFRDGLSSIADIDEPMAH